MLNGFVIHLLFKSRDLTPQHRRLAEIIEMIHTASLIHDDVLDDSGMRRGNPTSIRCSPDVVIVCVLMNLIVCINSSL